MGALNVQMDLLNIAEEASGPPQIFNGFSNSAASILANSSAPILKPPKINAPFVKLQQMLDKAEAGDKKNAANSKDKDNHGARAK